MTRSNDNAGELVVIRIRDPDDDDGLDEVLSLVRECNRTGHTRGRNAHGEWFREWDDDAATPSRIPPYDALARPELHSLIWSTATTRNRSRAAMKGSWAHRADWAFTAVMIIATVAAAVVGEPYIAAAAGFYTGGRFWMHVTDFHSPKTTWG